MISEDAYDKLQEEIEEYREQLKRYYADTLDEDRNLSQEDFEDLFDNWLLVTPSDEMVEIISKLKI